MPSIKIAVKSLSKRKLSSILFIVQLAITIFILNSSLLQLKANSYQEDQIRKYLNLDMNTTMHLSLNNVTRSEDFQAKFIVFEEFVNSLEGVTGFGGYDLTNTSFKELQENERFLEIRKELTKGSFKEQYPSAVEMFKMDRGTYQLAKLEIVKGRNFTDSDFETDQKFIPILIGNAYSEIMDLNQVITDSNTGIQYKVIGFIGNSSRWFNDQDFIGNMLVSLPDKFIAPYSLSEKKSLDNILTKSGALFYTVDKKYDNENIEMLIENKARELNLGAEIKTIEEELGLYKKNNREIFFYSMFISLFLGFMSLVGLISVSLSTIIVRKREFGIRLLTGATKSYLKFLIIEENFLIIAVSAFFSSLAIWIMNRLAVQQMIEDGEILDPIKNFNTEIILISLLVVIIITLLSSVIPVQKINSLQPIEMIGGNDR